MDHATTHAPSGPVLVTGARGFIGHHLVARLAAGGTEVHATSRNPEGPDGGVTWHRLDPNDGVATTRLVRSVRPEVIFHLAGVPVGRRDPELVVPILHGNLTAAVNVMSAGLDSGAAKVVLAGSMEEPDAGTVPSSPYAAAKGAATGYARMFHGLWGLPVTVLRVAMVYGPAQPDRRKLVPYVISSLLAGRSPALSSGDRMVDWVYVEDVVDAFLAAAASNRAGGASIPVGCGTGVSIREAVTMIGSLIGADRVGEFGAIDDRPMETARIADPTAARALLAWRATTPLRDGLARTIEWHREQLTASRPM